MFCGPVSIAVIFISSPHRFARGAPAAATEPCQVPILTAPAPPDMTAGDIGALRSDIVARPARSATGERPNARRYAREKWLALANPQADATSTTGSPLWRIKSRACESRSRL